MRQQKFLAGVSKFTNFSLFNRGLAVVNHLLLHFLTAHFVSETCAVKVESCLKSNLILNDFCFPKFYGGGAPPPKSCIGVITPT